MLLVPFGSTPHPLPFSTMGKCGKKEPGRAPVARAPIASLPPTLCQEVLFLAVAVASTRAEARGVCLHVSATVADRTCSPRSCAQPPAPSLLSLLSELPWLSRLLAFPCLGEVRPGSLPRGRMAQLTRLKVGRWRDSQASAPTSSTVIKSLPANGEDPLEEEMATGSSTLA